SKTASDISTLSLHDALPIYPRQLLGRGRLAAQGQADLVEEPVFLLGVARPAGGHHVLPDVLTAAAAGNDVVDVLGMGAAVLAARSEEHTSELQSLAYLVCRL